MASLQVDRLVGKVRNVYLRMRKTKRGREHSFPSRRLNKMAVKQYFKTVFTHLDEHIKRMSYK